MEKRRKMNGGGRSALSVFEFKFLFAFFSSFLFLVFLPFDFIFSTCLICHFPSLFISLMIHFFSFSRNCVSLFSVLLYFFLHSFSASPEPLRLPLAGASFIQLELLVQMVFLFFFQITLLPFWKRKGPPGPPGQLVGLGAPARLAKFGEHSAIGFFCN